LTLLTATVKTQATFRYDMPQTVELRSSPFSRNQREMSTTHSEILV